MVFDFTQLLQKYILLIPTIFFVWRKKTNYEIDLLLFCYIHVLFELSIFPHMPNWCTIRFVKTSYIFQIYLISLEIASYINIQLDMKSFSGVYMAMAAPNLLYFYVTSKFLTDQIIHFIDGRSPSKTYQNRFYSFISVFSRTTISWRGNATQGNIYDPA